MARPSINVILLVIILSSLAVGSIPLAFAARPVIYSSWTTSPPVIDGNFAAGEWSNLQITFKSPEYPSNYVLPTYVYFLNDASNLYVMVDAVGDTTDGVSDECLLLFNFEVKIKIEIIGASGTKITAPFTAAIGFGVSPNGAGNHKIYEFSIPLSYINAKPGQSITFSSPYWKYTPPVSMPYDSSTNRDNIWPVGANPNDEQTLGILVLGALRPVGGTLVPVNKLEILMPYLALAGLVIAVSAVVVVKRRHVA